MVVIVLALPPITATTMLCILLSAVAILLAWHDAPEMRLVHLGVSLIFAILLALEYIVVRGDVGRMNTVFKISFQLWVWVGLLIPLLLFWTLHNRRHIATALMLALIGIGLLYPLYAIPARYEDSLSGQITLDGDRFFDKLDLPEGSVTDDLDIIRYLRANAEGYPVIAEWYQTEYNWNSRFSVQTGLPAIVGWANHMRQQYGDTVAPEVDYRIAAMQSLYTSGDIETIRHIIDQYGVKYIIVGRLERTYASAAALEVFESMVQSGEIEAVFTSGDAIVYLVVH
jgi:uncharacterized membrane protein